MKLTKEDYKAYKESVEQIHQKRKDYWKVHLMALEGDEILLKWLETKVPKEKKKDKNSNYVD